MVYYTYGTSADNAVIVLEDAIPSTTPNLSGNYMYLQTDKKDIHGKRLSATKQLAARTSYNPRNGKIGTDISFTARVIKKDASSVHNDEVKISQALDLWRNSGQAPIYCFIYYLDTNSYHQFISNGTTFVNYLKGYVDDYHIKESTGLEVEVDIQFGECQS